MQRAKTNAQAKARFCDRCGAFVFGRCRDEIEPTHTPPWIGLKICYGPELYPMQPAFPSEADDAAPGTVEVEFDFDRRDGAMFGASVKILNPSKRTLVAAKQAQDNTLLGGDLNREAAARFETIPNKEFFGRRVVMLYLRTMDLKMVLFHVRGEGHIHILQLNFTPRPEEVKNDNQATTGSGG